jgi:hypothetical protein
MPDPVITPENNYNDFQNQGKADEVVEQHVEINLNSLFDSLMIIQTSVNEISTRQKTSEERLEHLEIRSVQAASARTSHSNSAHGALRAGIRRSAPAASFNEDPHTSREEESDGHENIDRDPYPHVEGDENQGIYLAVKDSVARVQLPSQLTLGDSNVPAKGETRNRLIFIRKSASYINTALKLMKSFGDKASITE